MEPSLFVIVRTISCCKNKLEPNTDFCFTQSYSNTERCSDHFFCFNVNPTEPHPTLKEKAMDQFKIQRTRLAFTYFFLFLQSIEVAM